METSDLKKIFAASAALSLIIFFISLPLSPVWAMHYSVYAVLAFINWFALSHLLVGITSRNFVSIAIGASIKPLLLVILLIVGKYMGIEITSFLAALNTFFVTLFIYMGFNHARARMMTPARVKLEG